MIAAIEQTTTATKERQLLSLQVLARRIAVSYAKRTGNPADDLEQEAMTRLWSSLHRYDPARGRLESWAAPIIYGAVLDYLRTKSYFLSGGKRTRRAQMVVSMETLNASHDGKFQPWEPEDRPHSAQHLSDATIERLKCLGQRDRLVVLLYYDEGLSMKEIAEQMGASEGYVSQLHTRIIERLRASALAA